MQSAIVLALLVLLCCSCTRNAPAPAPNDMTITLRWVKGYPSETKANVEVGLLWALSFLGAEFPDSSEKAFIWRGNLVTLDMERVRLAEGTRPAWERLIAAIEDSDEYRQTGGVDIGRFVMLTLCSPHDYYALTGVPRDLAEVRSKHSFEKEQMAIVESVIARGNRLLEIGAGREFDSIAFLGYEGTGAIRDGSFEKKEVEVVDFMKNGQLRFALYDLGGKLKANATPALTAAGKPSKCLWCHEIRLQRAFKNTTDLDGYHTTKEFDGIIADRMRIVGQYREGLHSRVDFKRTQDHTYAELLYLTFVEPSVERLALEWKMPVDQVAARLKGAETHGQKEFAWLGSKLYRREDVDELAPYKSIRVAADPREPSAYEPDLVGAQ